MFEGKYFPPLYTLLYDFNQGAQNKIFVNSDTSGGYYKTPSAATKPKRSKHRALAERLVSVEGGARERAAVDGEEPAEPIEEVEAEEVFDEDR